MNWTSITISVSRAPNSKFDDALHELLILAGKLETTIYLETFVGTLQIDPGAKFSDLQQLYRKAMYELKNPPRSEWGPQNPYPDPENP